MSPKGDARVPNRPANSSRPQTFAKRKPRALQSDTPCTAAEAV
ncbi:hypothetical protein [Kingella potus]|nr:hypothetical protein [Kingella potus]